MRSSARGTRRAPDRTRFGTAARSRGGRLLGWLGGGGGLVTLTGTASAHSGGGLGGASVSFPGVLWLPVLAGLLGGVVAIFVGAWHSTQPARHPGSRALGLLLVAIGGTMLIGALATRPLLGVGGASAGVLGVRWITARRESGRWRRGDRADLAFGSLCAHRALEGAALGALYTTSAAVGAVGVIVVAGHAALETVAVGGLYSTRRLLAVAAITIVQGGYLAGALVGVGGAGAVPESVRAAMIGLLAGVLVLEGVSRLRRASRHVLESGAAVTAR